MLPMRTSRAHALRDEGRDTVDEETWGGLHMDVKGESYEGLLEKNTANTKSGTGQCFTPHALIKAMPNGPCGSRWMPP